MRILFFSSPLHGHVIPLIPVARAFRDRGDSVALVSAEVLAPLVAAEGIEFLAAGPGAEGVMVEMVRRTGIDPVEAGQTSSPETVAEMFAGVRVDLGYQDSLIHAREFGPDLIVAEALDFVGPVVAAALGVPYATVALGPAVPPEFMDLLIARAARASAEHDLEYRAPDWYLDPCPASLQIEQWQAPRNHFGLRPEPFSAGGSTLPELSQTRERTGRRRVLASFGTLFSDPGLMSALLTSLLALDIEVCVTLGLATAESDFSVHDERVQYVGFTPLAALLDGVDAVLTVGGSGTVLGALSRGLPMVLLPQGADQPINAARVAAVGAGIALPVGPASPDAVAEAVAQVLDKPDYRLAAERMAEEIRALPSAHEIAASLIASI